MYHQLGIFRIGMPDTPSVCFRFRATATHSNLKIVYQLVGYASDFLGTPCRLLGFWLLLGFGFWLLLLLRHIVDNHPFIRRASSTRLFSDTLLKIGRGNCWLYGLRCLLFSSLLHPGFKTVDS